AYQPVTRGALLALPALHGSIDTLARARAALPPLPAILNALEELENLARLAGRADVTIDLGDLRGYEYESGAMFALYVPGLPNAVARGGRYDHVGEAFGRARPATGFSMDLRELARLLPDIEPQSAVRAPWTNDPALQQIIVALRNAGEIVVQDFPGQEHHDEGLVCDRLLAFEGGEWVLKSL
ncbi:MAG: phosphoribosyltransferase regulatory subunit, partial [Paucimonas sp.]|nr:phosphoribosyltransferase regulatory subunit [Paucimonas sp.]